MAGLWVCGALRWSGMDLSVYEDSWYPYSFHGYPIPNYTPGSDETELYGFVFRSRVLVSWKEICIIACSMASPILFLRKQRRSKMVKQIISGYDLGPICFCRSSYTHEACPSDHPQLQVRLLPSGHRVSLFFLCCSVSWYTCSYPLEPIWKNRCGFCPNRELIGQPAPLLIIYCNL